MGEPIRVLHVEDEPDFLDLVATMLEAEDDQFVVKRATTASEGLGRLDETIDCVVSDYEMPGLDGLELLAAVREEYPELPFILYTARGSESIASDAISAGVTDYLEKAGGTEQYAVLANRIENAVEQYRARQRADRLDRIRSTVRDVNQELVRSRDRADLERRVCEIVTDGPPYAFAWIGEADPDAGTVVPQASAGADDDYPAAITITLDESQTDQPPTARALRTNDLVVTQSIADEEPVDPWREQALERGFAASAAVPLSFEDRQYGVLTVYSGEREPFDGAERDLLRELAGDLGHAFRRFEQERRYRQLFERSLNAIAVHEIVTDEEGEPIDYVFLEANGAFEDATGLDREAIVGERATDILPDLDPTFIETYGTVALSGEPVEFEHYAESLGRRYSITAFPLGDGQFVTTFFDVTDRHERERELEAMNDRLETVRDQLELALETTSACTFDWRPGESEIQWYPTFEDVFGIDATDVEPIFDAYFELIPPDHRERVRSAIEAAIDGGTDYDLTYPVQPHDEQLWVREQAEVMDDEDGPRVVGTVTDVTELKAYERRLERQNERLDEFAEVISHDLRNPLNVAFGRAELLAENCESDHTRPLLDALDRMDDIVGNTLTLARQGDTVGETDPVPVKSVVAECAEMIDSEAETVEVPEEFGIRGDPDRIRHVFENLLSNAVDHATTPTDEQATERAGVTVRIDRIDDRGFYVADDGPGIPAEERDDIFESGYTTTVDGTGLGLTIVERIAEAHDWDVSVTESREGGARFEFTGVDIV
ncbi:ATP-binding protein [Halorhabdus sp. SVX81]|uniref:ATP-binding protein n=1 Tax=Halorhabdus sp. SVX81 TaxID=2978283 RepID=UPI0023DC1DC1|nr:ATP-binding protein [Halorhabdus sp. SVX81]